MIKIDQLDFEMDINLPNIGIWNWIEQLSLRNNFTWRLYIHFHDKRYVVNKDGIFSDDSIVPIPGLTAEATSAIENGICHVYIPVRCNNLDAFILHIQSKTEISTKRVQEIAFLLKSLVVAESEQLFKYPSFLPFFLPGLGNHEAINKKIIHKERVFFLNGQEGTGKKTFIRNFILYHFFHDIGDKNSIAVNLAKENITDQNEKVKIRFIEELALMEAEEQKLLTEDLDNSNNNQYFFINSIYDVDMLLERGIINEEIYKHCRQNRLMFPALNKRVQEALQIIQYILRVKGVDIPGFILDGWNKRPLTKSGFESLFTQILPVVDKFGSLGEKYEKKQDLRDMVADLEINSIRLALIVHGSSQNKIAKFLGISRGSLQHKLKKYDFPYHNWEE